VITAIVLVETSADSVPEAAERIADLDGVREVYSVTGDVDLVAVVRVPRHEDLAEVIADRLGKVEGVLRTRTYLAFQQYSKPDLEAAFDLGLDDA
jgi:DNA-binding Lrp family transcriptional regulator